MSSPDDSNAKEKVAQYYDDVSHDYGAQYNPANLMTLAKYPANYFRMQMLLELLATTDARRVYEVGTGEGTPLGMVANAGYEVAGCDIARNMVKLSIANLKKAGVEDPDIRVADIEDFSTLADQVEGGFDFVYAFGVIPHVSNDRLMLENIRKILGGKGKVYIEFRNKAFSLFTHNRYTHDFIMDDILADVPFDVKAGVADELKRKMDMDQPPVAETAAPHYTKIRATFHNPFTLPALFEQAGFSNPKIHWYHYHPSLPKFEKALGGRWREAGFAMERAPSDWRGYFLCSAGIVEADLNQDA